jgi:adenosine kinase
MGPGNGVLLGMGNPLLDLSVSLDGIVGKVFLKKYDLEPNNAILCSKLQKPMYEEMATSFEVEYIAGGATQNAIRVAQWLLGAKKSTTYFGCIGNDKFGKVLQEKAEEDGVNAVYQINQEVETGTCAVVCTDGGKNRSLVANLGSADLFTIDHINVLANWTLVTNAAFYYIAGFFLTVSPESIMKIAEHACETNKVFTMNLSAPFLCQFFKGPMMAALPYVDILFGNESEAATFSKEQDLGTEDIKEIAKKIASMPKTNSKRSRMVVFTQGELPIIVCQDGVITEFPVATLEPAEMVDTNGAGDAFVGGFLAQLAKGKPVAHCVELGKRAAKMIIGRSGCTFPEAAPKEITEALSI